MFRENKDHLQCELFGIFNTVSPAMLKKMTSSSEYLFYLLIHCQIDEQIFKIFERVYQEHFSVVAEKVIVRSSEEMSSSFVQSPDDLDAAFREKNGHQIKGHVISIVETATPGNAVN